MHISHDVLHVAKTLTRPVGSLGGRDAVFDVTCGTHVDMKVDFVPHIAVDSAAAYQLRNKRSDSHITPVSECV
jgi:hypothetical protein